MASATGGGLTRARRSIAAVAVAWTTLLLLLALEAAQASPGPEGQELTGVGIGHYAGETGIAYLSGRRLRCAPTASAPFTSRCTVMLAGRELELLARRNPPGHPLQLGGECQATFAGRTYTCHMSSRHVHVHWFVYIYDALGLDRAQLDAIRRAYPLENLPEEWLVGGMLLVSLLSAALAGATAALQAAASQRRPRTIAAAALAWALLALIGTFVAYLHLTGGLWD